MSRVTECDWFEIWYDDKIAMIETIARNMASDLACGYNYFGNAITQQREMLETYKRDFDTTIDSFKSMEDKQVSRWCYYDLKKRGVI